MSKELPKTFAVLPRADVDAMAATNRNFAALLDALHQRTTSTR